jgi:outer membrane immunogenic protein
MRKLSAISAGVLAASVLLTSSVFAAHNYKGEAGYKDVAPCPPAERGLQSGFYVGAQAGYDFYSVRKNISLDGGVFTSNPTIAATGAIGGLFLGYGQYFNDMWYLGIEGAGNATGASNSWSATSAAGTVNTKYSASSSWNLAVLPGLKLNVNSLLYVRLGYAWDRVKGQITTPTTSGSKSQWSNGFMYGLGLESVLSGNWSLRTEYNHTSNNSFNTTHVKFSPADNQVLLGVVYHFA